MAKQRQILLATLVLMLSVALGARGADVPGAGVGAHPIIAQTISGEEGYEYGATFASDLTIDENGNVSFPAAVVADFDDLDDVVITLPQTYHVVWFDAATNWVNVTPATMAGQISVANLGTKDHDLLDGLLDDDHTIYLLADGTRNLSSYIDIDTVADPGAPAVNDVRFFANGGDHLIAICPGDVWHDLSAGAKGVSSYSHQEVTISDEGGLNIQWGAGEIFDALIMGGSQMVAIAAETGNQAMTASSLNFIYYDQSITDIAYSDSSDDVDWEDGDFIVANVATSHNDVIEIGQAVMGHEDLHQVREILNETFKAVVHDGLIVSEHAGANAFDVDQTAGSFTHSGLAHHHLSAVDSTATDIRRWFHDATDTWEMDTNSQIDAANWDNISDGVAPIANTAARYYRSAFYTDEGNIHWVYPQEEFVTLNLALVGSDPVPPPLLEHLPATTVVVLKGNDASFPTAGGDRWVDVRPILGGGAAGGTITDHGNLSGLADDDHTQYVQPGDTPQYAGADDTTQGSFDAYGNATTGGGGLDLYLGGTDDAYAVDYFRLLVDGLGPGPTPALIFGNAVFAEFLSLQQTAAGTAEVTVNRLNADIDFAIGGDTTDDVFKVDAGTELVTVATNFDCAGEVEGDTLDINGAADIAGQASIGDTAYLAVQARRTNNAQGGPAMQLHHDRDGGTPANDDHAGTIIFETEDADGDFPNAVMVQALIPDMTDDAEYGELVIGILENAVENVERCKIDGSGVDVTGIVTATDDVNATDDLISGDDLNVGGLATVAETLAVTGDATFDEAGFGGESAPATGIAIGSTDGSNAVDLYHDNSHAYLQWDDGALRLTALETNATGDVRVYGNGSGAGIFRVYDEDRAEWADLSCNTGIVWLRPTGTNPVNTQISANESAKAALIVKNSGNDPDRYGLDIWCGEDTVDADDNYAIRVFDGNGGAVGYAVFDDDGGMALDWAVASDESLKQNIRPTELDGLAVIVGVSVSDYEMKVAPERPCTGFVAQNVEEAYSRAVVTLRTNPSTGQDVLGVAKTRLLIPLVVATQQQQERIEALEAENATQAAQIADLIARVGALERVRFDAR